MHFIRIFEYKVQKNHIYFLNIHFCNIEFLLSIFFFFLKKLTYPKLLIGSISYNNNNKIMVNKFQEFSIFLVRLFPLYYNIK